MATHGVEIWVDGEKSAGIWQCAPGPSHWTLDVNEVIYVVSGRMTVTPDGGEPSEIGAGDIAVFPLGLDGHLGDPRDRAQGLRDLLRPSSVA